MFLEAVGSNRQVAECKLWNDCTMWMATADKWKIKVRLDKELKWKHNFYN